MQQDAHDAVASARCWLFTPGTRTERYDRAADAGADAVILDLEDSVADDDKATARRQVLRYLTSPRGTIVHALRVNAIGTVSGLRDIAEFIDSDADADVLVLPKTESAGDLIAMRDILAQSGKRALVMPIIESARGVRDLQTILTDTGGVAGVMVGAADLAADIGGQPDWDVLATARSQILIAASAARVPVIDSPFFDINDSAGLKAETEAAHRFGFAAKAAIHPGQVPVINERFTPTEAQRIWAHRVLEVNQAGVGSVDGHMVDQAVARRAHKILARST